VKVLPKLKIADVIGKAVWYQRGDIGDVISIGKLIRKNDGSEEVEQILATIIKYGTNNYYSSNSISGAGSNFDEYTNYQQHHSTVIFPKRECYEKKHPCTTLNHNYHLRAIILTRTKRFFCLK